MKVSYKTIRANGHYDARCKARKDGYGMSVKHITGDVYRIRYVKKNLMEKILEFFGIAI